MCRRKLELSISLDSIELLQNCTWQNWFCFSVSTFILAPLFIIIVKGAMAELKRWLILMVNVNMYVVGSLWHSENAYWGLKCVVCTDTKIITNFHNWNINCTENIQLRDIMHKKSMLWMHFANQYDETNWGDQMDLAHAVAPL